MEMKEMFLIEKQNKVISAALWEVLFSVAASVHLKRKKQKNVVFQALRNTELHILTRVNQVGKISLFLTFGLYYLTFKSLPIKYFNQLLNISRYFLFYS